MRRSITAVAALLIASCGSQEKSGNASAEGNAAKASGPAAAAAAGGGAGTVSLTPGKYETRIEVLRMDIANGPRLPAGMAPPLPPPTVVRSCLTPEQARRPDANFLTGSGAQGGCNSQNLSMAGGRIQGTVTCTNQGTTIRTTMNGQFSADGYAVESQSRIEANEMTMETASRITTRRIGDCPAS